MTVEGTSVKDIVAKGVIEEGTVGQLGSNVYKSFIADMKTWESQFGIATTVAPYDWRLDYNTIIKQGKDRGDGYISYTDSLLKDEKPYIRKKLEELASASATGKVSIIGHSMGGVVAKTLLSSNADLEDLVGNLILVASPQLGTPKAVAALLHGTEAEIPNKLHFGSAMTEKEARHLAKNMPSEYELLPSSAYFTYTYDPVITFDLKTLPDWAAKFGEKIKELESLRKYLVDEKLDTPPVVNELMKPEIANNILLANAEKTHSFAGINKGIDNWLPTKAHLVTIAGWGEETLSGIKYRTTTCAEEDENHGWACTVGRYLTFNI